MRIHTDAGAHMCSPVPLTAVLLNRPRPAGLQMCHDTSLVSYIHTLPISTLQGRAEGSSISICSPKCTAVGTARTALASPHALAMLVMTAWHSRAHTSSLLHRLRPVRHGKCATYTVCGQTTEPTTYPAWHSQQAIVQHQATLM